MTITASDVNKLRQMTGAGLMDCKKALQESNGDFDAAIDYLRKKGQKVAAKRADRDAKEGVVIALTSDDNTKGYVVHVTSETDFVAKNQEFIEFAQSVAEAAKTADAADAETLYNQPLGNITVREKFEEMAGKIGEKIEIGRYERVTGETVVPYIHGSFRIGVLVAMNRTGNGKLEEVGKDVAMQIAAMNPIAVAEQDVPEEVKQKEIEIGMELARQEGKPEAMVERIAQGKLQRFYKDNTLVHQQFVKDSSKTVAQVLKETDPALQVLAFRRVSVGE